MRSYLLPILAALFAVWLLEISPDNRQASFEPLAKQPPTRLVVFWIDAMADTEAVDPALLPRLQARLAKGALHGPARACADAVSVPCFTAMITGVDRFSMFALGRNFGARSGAMDGSVLREMQRLGHRIGYIGVPMFQHVVDGADYVQIDAHSKDVPVIQSALSVLDREKLDFLIVHLHETDDIAHRKTPSSEEYKRGMREIDQAIDVAIAQLKPTDHAFVMGDHGHTIDGRHFAGLDVPTYAALIGPRATRPLRVPMAVSDYGHIWGHLFGVRFGAHDFVDDYFAGASVKVPSELPNLPSGAPTPLWACLACLSIGFLLGGGTELPALLAIRASRKVVASLLLVTCFALLGFAFTSLRPLLSYRPLSVSLLVIAATGVAVALAAHRLGGAAQSRPSPLELGALGVTLFALPTVYKYGGTFAILSALGVTIAAVAVRAYRSGHPRKAALTMALWLPLYAFWNPAVRNFAVRWFPVFSEWIPSYATLACVACAAAILAVPTQRATSKWLPIAGVLGLVVSALAGHVTPFLYVLPCALAVPLCFVAMRKLAVAPVALGLALPALWFAFERDAIAVGPIAATLVLWAYLPLAMRGTSARLRGFALIALVLATFWASMGCRMSGINFNFFFAWLSADIPVTKMWAPTGIFTLLKYLIAPALGLLLAHLASDDETCEAFSLCAATARARLGLVTVFLSAFSFAAHDAGPFLKADLTQEVVLWVIVLGVVACLPRTSPLIAEPQAALAE